MSDNRIMILNGPNLNRLGTREPEIYGTLSLADIEAQCAELADELGLVLDFRQTNDEAELITWLHEAADSAAGVILNPAAFTHYSYAVGDACALVNVPIIETHLSNPASREAFRHTSVVAGYVTGTIAGFGAASYLLALRAMATLLAADR
jgi:3-dehydroquinate dehydratase II